MNIPSEAKAINANQMKAGIHQLLPIEKKIHVEHI